MYVDRVQIRFNRKARVVHGQIGGAVELLGYKRKQQSTFPRGTLT